MESSEVTKRLKQLERQVSEELEQIARLRKLLWELNAQEVDKEATQIQIVLLESQLISLLQQRERLRAELNG